ncbi:MAG: hypothetical protein QM800_05610 [Paludibacter sp.]
MQPILKAKLLFYLLHSETLCQAAGLGDFIHYEERGLDHAVAANIGFMNRVNTPVENYNNAKEKRVITNSERKTAKANGETPNNKRRASHYGWSIQTTSPTSTHTSMNKSNPESIINFWILQNPEIKVIYK